MPKEFLLEDKIALKTNLVIAKNVVNANILGICRYW